MCIIWLNEPFIRCPLTEWSLGDLTSRLSGEIAIGHCPGPQSGVGRLLSKYIPRFLTIICDRMPSSTIQSFFSVRDNYDIGHQLFTDIRWMKRPRQSGVSMVVCLTTYNHRHALPEEDVSHITSTPFISRLCKGSIFAPNDSDSIWRWIAVTSSYVPFSE